MSGAKSVVVINMLETHEAMVSDCDVALNNSAVLQRVDVSGVDGIRKVTNFGAGSVTGYAFAVLNLQRQDRCHQ